MSVFSIIIAVIKAIPIIKEWFDQLAAYYVEREIANMKTANRESIAKAIKEHDQRDLEKAIGNPNAGEKSNLGGTEIRDSLPGVK